MPILYGIRVTINTSSLWDSFKMIMWGMSLWPTLNGLYIAKDTQQCSRINSLSGQNQHGKRLVISIWVDPRGDWQARWGKEEGILSNIQPGFRYDDRVKSSNSPASAHDFSSQRRPAQKQQCKCYSLVPKCVLITSIRAAIQVLNTV